jgi:hypothetical protein
MVKVCPTLGELLYFPVLMKEMPMKEHLQSNIITKHLAGWSTAEEERFIHEWLKKNPHHAATYQAIRQHYLRLMARQELSAL